MILKTKRKIWKPSTASSSLVITIPKEIEFLKEGDEVTLKLTSDKKLVIEKA
ncbi:MAG: AbrB/MazE/SpoVT family DNA-binding domain-containing protein [Candidatus Aenigmarchaeota archaeon]|nr:AbrB/MazE/SpoVT family DNA-binding domain-containing protein [Candidatus Aenigmarchaeota archaeon]